MKTVQIKNSQLKVTYKTSSDMRTKAVFNGRTYTTGLSCSVYNVDDDSGHVVLVLDDIKGELLKSTTVIKQDEYQAIADLYDPYAGGRYHTALLQACGAENLLRLR